MILHRRLPEVLIVHKNAFLIELTIIILHRRLPGHVYHLIIHTVQLAKESGLTPQNHLRKKAKNT